LASDPDRAARREPAGARGQGGGFEAPEGFDARRDLPPGARADPLELASVTERIEERSKP
jgi:hypothetical protein